MMKKIVILIFSLIVSVAFVSASGSEEKSKKPVNQSASDKKTAEEGLQAYNAENFSKAAKLLDPLIKKKNKTALAVMGMMYENGFGVAQDNKEASRLFDLALASGWRGVIENRLGMLYLLGTGVPRDPKKAEQNFLLAGESDQFAQRNLADLYLSEPDFFNENNLQKAASFAAHAVSLGNKSAKLLQSTAECALKSFGSERAVWDNLNHLAGYELKGNVMRLSWEYHDPGEYNNLFFGKSGALYLKYSKFGQKYINVERYYYDDTCNLVHIDNMRGEVVNPLEISWSTNFQKDLTWSHGQIIGRESSDLISSTIETFHIPNGETFTIEKVKTTWKKNTTFRSIIEHRDQDGRLKWSEEDHFPFDFWNVPLQRSRGYIEPNQVYQNTQGYFTYDEGFYYKYDQNGQIERIVDHAGRNNQERGTINYVYNNQGLLINANYNENYVENEHIFRENEVRIFTDYLVDAKGNWTNRVCNFTHNGSAFSPRTVRRIVYWN